MTSPFSDTPLPPCHLIGGTPSPYFDDVIYEQPLITNINFVNYKIIWEKSAEVTNFALRNLTFQH